MSSRKLQKEIENTFKKINEGLESFNYHYDRHEDLNTQVLDRNLESQKEKLETDLKREIKKLQKHRELIKGWQLNDNIEVVVTSSRLQEYRKLVEEAMEKYKDVEKSSKMKSFSNQSIMLASLEDQSNYSKEAIEVLKFLQECVEDVTQQIENLDLEYEKISSRKTKKNSSVESEKQEIEGFLNNDKFHLESFERIIDYIKQNQIDPELVIKIKEDITFFLESNQEPDYIDDETLYDEIFQQAESNYKYTPKQQETILEETVDSNGVPQPSESTPTPTPVTVPKKKSKSPTPITPVKKAVDTTPVKNRLATPDIASPEIVQKLRPAVTPLKVSGEVAWSSVASGTTGASGATNNIPLSASSSTSNNSESPRPSTVETSVKSDASKEEFRGIDTNHPYSKYVDVLEDSGLTGAEIKLFSDIDLVKLPPGFQSLIMSFTATRNLTESNPGKLLYNLASSNFLSSPIQKPFLPRTVQNSFYLYNDYNPNSSFIKPPLHLLNYQNYWNKVRAADAFEALTKDVESLMQHEASPQNISIINELIMVFFYGFYYGLTPLENLIAESKLFELGWRPYSIKSVNQLICPSASMLSPDKYLYWVRSLNPIAEVSEYQVFDLSLWEIHLKAGKLDSSLADNNQLSLVS